MWYYIENSLGGRNSLIVSHNILIYILVREKLVQRTSKNWSQAYCAVRNSGLVCHHPTDVRMSHWWGIICLIFPICSYTVVVKLKKEDKPDYLSTPLGNLVSWLSLEKSFVLHLQTVHYLDLPQKILHNYGKNMNTALRTKRFGWWSTVLWLEWMSADSFKLFSRTNALIL